jgi:hypothetical protein
MLAAAAAIAVGWTSFDVDGDGRADAVTLTRHQRSFVLHVVTGGRVVEKVVRGFSGPQATGQGEPRIVALRPINRRRGLEIIVRVWHGASNDFLIVYTLDRGQLVAMPGGPHDPADAAFVWDLGGSAGTAMSQADCVGRGRVGVNLEWYHRGVWHQRLTLYRVFATRFRRTAVYEIASRQLRTLPRDWPKVKGVEFESCGGTRVSQ